MSERYTKLFSLPENLYAAGSPVIIAAGALLKDNQTGDVLAQLKLRSVSEKTVQAVKVCLNLFDTAGSPIGESVLFDYLDLRAARDAEFGKKTPVPVPEIKARSYTAAVTEVVFSDKSTWVSNGTKFEPLPRQRTLEDIFRDTELVKQYKIAVGSNFSFYPMLEKDLWFCACGAVNHDGKPCHVCKRTLPELQSIDRERLVRDKDARLAEEARRAAEEKAAADAQRKKTAKLLKIVIPAVCVLIAAAALVKFAIIPTMKYNDAVSLMNAGQYEEAIASFEALDGYKDSTQKIIDCEDAIENLRLQKLYDAAAELADSGKKAEAAIAFGKLGDFRDSRERSFALWDDVAVRDTVSARCNHTIGLKSDGTVVAVGENDDGECDVSSWTNIVAVSTGWEHTVGLKSDGTVVAVGKNEYGQCNVSGWKDVVAVSTGDRHTVGLKSDGTVVAVGWNEYGQCNVSDWKDIVTVSAEGWRTAGLKSDGTVVTAGDNRYDQCNVSGWRDIVAVNIASATIGLKSNGTVVAAGLTDEAQNEVSKWREIVAVSISNHHIVGLKSDGTVITEESSDGFSCDISKWTDIVSVSAGTFHIVGLKSDGTVVAAGDSFIKKYPYGNKGQYNFGNWKDVVAIRTGGSYTVGLKSDGTVVAVGDNEHGQCDVSNWTDIKLPK